MNIKKSQKNQGIQLSQQTNKILLSSFIIGLLGPPGAGKSTLIQQFLTNQDFYSKKFNRVLFVGQSNYKNLVQDQFNTKKHLDIDWIYNHIRQANKWGCKNMLIIFDDVISQLKQSNVSVRLQQLFYNRRHLLKQGTISIIVTSQKWTSFPKFLRTCINGLIIFGTNKYQAQSCWKEIRTNIGKTLFADMISKMQAHQFVFFNFNYNKIFDKNWTCL